MTKKLLSDRVALITGASRGIGAAVATAFAAQGAHVILLARTVGGLEQTDDAIRAAGGSATLLPLDLRQPNEIESLGSALLERFGKLDIFVGNAAILGALSPVANSDFKMWQDVYTTNVLANVRLIQTLDPLLRASPAGRAMFVTTGDARRGQAFWSPYVSSKAALEQVVLSYAAEVEQSSLRVNLIDPGPVRTAMRAEALPGENPQSLPSPETVMDAFVRLATEACSLHAARVQAQA